jgi:hypothetical protein
MVLTLLLSATLVGCAHAPLGGRWVRSEAYVGLSKPDGSLISNTEWQTFLDEVVTPEFPAGLSVVDVAGQWRNAAGHIDREHSKMLVLLHPSSAEIEAKIDAIHAAYRVRFGQEAVMKVTSSARVAF